MRQYRGLTKEGKWVYGWYVKIEEKHCIITTESRFDYEEDYNVIFKGIIEVIPETVGQQTGLKDKKRTKEYPKGQEIYEGDILQGYGNSGRLVEWEGIGWNPFEDDVIDAEDSVRYEVIGNVYQRPELLK